MPGRSLHNLSCACFYLKGSISDNLVKKVRPCLKDWMSWWHFLKSECSGKFFIPLFKLKKFITHKWGNWDLIFFANILFLKHQWILRNILPIILGWITVEVIFLYFMFLFWLCGCIHTWSCLYFFRLSSFYRFSYFFQLSCILGLSKFWRLSSF